MQKVVVVLVQKSPLCGLHQTILSEVLLWKAVKQPLLKISTCAQLKLTSNTRPSKLLLCYSHQLI